ncbi:zinc finger MYM-type protein 1-like [Nilaparvata lugens]|uniref:zinc finger MYM-type protein 1-like n=1 Tax=Nilaparvata lugens TaxID=108931 RepID=UPI00193EAF11|nr:zinc finger MYM-type protein 1-like [Nilaparvata lugens]
MLDETSDVRKKSQLSTILRFVRENGCVEERFIGFTDVSADRSADGLLAHVKRTVETYNLADKFVAQTYDGAAVMSGHLTGLQKKVQDEYPTALFTHCYAHVLNLVLSQGMNEIHECNVFFSTLNGISTFSSRSSKRSFAVQQYLKKSIPSFAPTRWCFTSRLVNTIETYREEIIEFFNRINENENDEWKGADRCTAMGFIQYLESFQTVFLLNTFSPLFSQTDLIYNILQSEQADIMTCLNVIRDFGNELKFYRKGVISCKDCKEKETGRDDISCDQCKTVGFK